MKAKKTNTPKARPAQEKLAGDEQAEALAPALRQAQLPKETVQVNLDDFYELQRLKDFLDNALSPDPHVVGLEDGSYHAYKRIDVLLTCWGLVTDGLHAQGSELVESIDGYMQDLVSTEVQMMRLAAKVLYEIHIAQERTSAANGRSTKAHKEAR